MLHQITSSDAALCGNAHNSGCKRIDMDGLNKLIKQAKNNTATVKLCCILYSSDNNNMNGRNTIFYFNHVSCAINHRRDDINNIQQRLITTITYRNRIQDVTNDCATRRL